MRLGDGLTGLLLAIYTALMLTRLFEGNWRQTMYWFGALLIVYSVWGLK